MKLKIYTFITFTLFSLSALSQVTLNKADLTATAGDSVRMHAADYMAEGSSGANVNWDFSALKSNGSVLITYMNPQSTMWSDSFSSSASFVANQESLYFEYSGIDDASLFLMGSVSDYDSDTVVQVFSDPIMQLKFPCTYNTSFTDDYFSYYNFLGFYVTSTGTVNGTVDGWGTLKLPWGTVSNTLRLKFVDNRKDSFNMGFGPEVGYVTTTRYTWYKAGNPNPVLNIVTVSSSQATQKSAAYVDEYSYRNVGIDKLGANFNLSVYPNPIHNTETLTIDYTSDYQIDIDEVIITDVSGKVIQYKEIINNTSSIIKLDIYSLTTGLYFVTLKSGNASVTKKLTVH